MTASARRRIGPARRRIAPAVERALVQLGVVASLVIAVVGFWA
ncbi:MAG TPA: hypothetical protein VFA50_09280 [Stellaceae bacterium]|nr:hypothetical protein [Stellaceae bacterium]